MTIQQLIERNEALRTRLKGGVIQYGWNAANLDPGIRWRAGYRMTLPHDDISPQRDSGSFKFAGFLFRWSISECFGEATLTLDVEEDLLINRR